MDYFFVIYQDKFSLFLSDFISLLSYEKCVCYFNFTEVEQVYMEVKVYIFINDISGKVNGMHEYILPITDMQLLLLCTVCQTLLSVSYLAFCQCKCLLSNREFGLHQHLTYFKQLDYSCMCCEVPNRNNTLIIFVISVDKTLQLVAVLSLA